MQTQVVRVLLLALFCVSINVVNAAPQSGYGYFEDFNGGDSFPINYAPKDIQGI